MSKIIRFKGKQYKVPDYAKYIAQDEDGSVWVFEHKPVQIYVSTLGSSQKATPINVPDSEDDPDLKEI